MAVSDNMFVHNNSKHGRRAKRLDPTEGKKIPLLSSNFRCIAMTALLSNLHTFDSTQYRFNYLANVMMQKVCPRKNNTHNIMQGVSTKVGSVKSKVIFWTPCIWEQPIFSAALSGSLEYNLANFNYVH